MTDDGLIEAMARHVAGLNGHSDDWERYLEEAADYLDFCRPIIEAQEKDKYAKVALETYSDPDRLKYTHDTYTSGFSDCKLKIFRAIVESTNG